MKDLSDENCKYGLIIGDSHIPRRAKTIPAPIHDEIINFTKDHGSFDKVFCTGDIVHSEDYIQFLESLDRKKEILIVQGNMDFYNGVDNPLEMKYQFENYKEIRIGLIHGHQISPRGDVSELIKYTKKMGSNILISGHTHADSIILKENILLLNPGSCVGAWSFIASGIPSFFIIKLVREKTDLISLSILIFKYNQKIEKSVQTFKFQNQTFFQI